MIELTPNTMIAGKYRLRSPLGEGTQGIVYRAEQLDSEGQVLHDVALKMIRSHLSKDSGFCQRFLREIRVTARLRSPHTVTVFDTGQTEQGQLYYTMELVQGQTLKEILVSTGPLSVLKAVRITIQICDALTAAHHLPIVHRDLKPENIFLEERQGQELVKVGDFGIAKSWESPSSN
jgi:eukaryotic-like serine/threonine-protein kinase